MAISDPMAVVSAPPAPLHLRAACADGSSHQNEMRVNLHAPVAPAPHDTERRFLPTFRVMRCDSINILLKLDVPLTRPLRLNGIR